MEDYGYSKENPPKDCLQCEYHKHTYALSTGCHTYWHDFCEYINCYFAKMHIVLRGEFRRLKNHDEDDLKGHIPYECPFFSTDQIFWEHYGIIHMDYEIFIIECEDHPEEYKGKWIYSMPANIDYLMYEIPAWMGLHYLYVEEKDKEWFQRYYGLRTVLISPCSPADWTPPVPND